MRAEVVVAIALVAAMPVVFLVMFTWDTHKKLRETDAHFGRRS